MIVDLATISGSASYDLSFPVEEIDLETEGVKLTGEVHIVCDIVRHIIETNIAGTIDASVEIDCTRCLQPIDEKLTFPFEVSFVAPDAFPVDKEVELRETDLGMDISEDEQIDLKEIAREQILLNLPEQIVCSADCKGLCEKCGANRNNSECTCGDKEIDPRWSALKGLK